ncbi:MAG TPA: hypothetical protein VF017_15495 [Thermoanaerobaculia bacterium]|nr:hypothetical protein [Thermoanaerobaculia bacterium]
MRLMLTQARPEGRDDAYCLVDFQAQIELADDFASRPVAERTAEWTVIRPIDLTNSHGVNFTPEFLAGAADDYDPEIEVATVNFDHAWGGPAHGRAAGVRIADGGGFVATVTHLSDEAVAGIQSGQWFRVSTEWALSHHATGRPYFRGIALLGAAPPGCWGLPPIELSAHPKEGPTMSTPQSVAPAPPTAPPTTTTAAEPDAQLSAARQALEAATALRAEVALERARLRVEKLLSALPFVTPAMRKAGLEELLVSLAAAPEDSVTVKLTATGGDGKATTTELSAYAALELVLRAMPSASALAGVELAGEETTEGKQATHQLSAAEQKAHAAAGLTPERVAHLTGKYGLEI